eukprot:11524311-Alexandrium_andersonii.AAC.1
MRFTLIRPHLESLYSHGSFQAKPAHMAESEEAYYLNEPNDVEWYDPEDWYYSDEAYPDDIGETDEAGTEDGAQQGETEADGDDDAQAVMRCEEAEMNYRQARQHLNAIRAGRKFGKG